MEIILSVFSIILGIADKIKNYLPFITKPYLQINYQRSNNNIRIIFINIGGKPIKYFTAEINSKNGNFSIKDSSADFELKPSGGSGNYVVISGENILPKQRGVITITLLNPYVTLKSPEVKTDGKFKFCGSVNIKVGPEEILI